MIDWYKVIFGSLWIIGLGFETSTFSIASYLVSQRRLRFSQVLGMPSCQIMIDLGLVFFCVGLAGSVSILWERIVWSVLAIIMAWRFWQDRKRSHG